MFTIFTVFYCKKTYINTYSTDVLLTTAPLEFLLFVDEGRSIVPH
jgi:hypothetical protein